MDSPPPISYMCTFPSSASNSFTEDGRAFIYLKKSSSVASFLSFAGAGIFVRHHCPAILTDTAVYSRDPFGLLNTFSCLLCYPLEICMLFIHLLLQIGV